MTRIGFYILRAAEPQAFICRLAQQLYQRGQSVYIHAADPPTVQQLDDALWTYRPDAFLPHDVVGADQAEATPILLGDSEPPEDRHEVLINLAPDVPLFFSRFERVAEIIPAQEALKTAGRQRFQFYRDRGYPLDTYQDVDG